MKEIKDILLEKINEADLVLARNLKIIYLKWKMFRRLHLP